VKISNTSRRHLSLILVLLPGLVLTRPLLAQVASGDSVDALAIPFRVAFFPLRMLGKANAQLIGLAAELAKPRETSLLESLIEAGVRPAFGSIGSRSGFGAGVLIDRWSPFYLESHYSIRGSQRHGVGIDWDRGRYRLETGYLFTRDAEPHFWGIGPDTRKSDVTDYRWDRQAASAVGTLRLSGLSLVGGAGYEDNRVARGSDDDVADLQDLPAEEQPFGLNERTQYFVFNLGSALDRTFVVSHQLRGVLLAVGSSLFLGTDGTDSDFHRLNLTVHTYAPLNPRQSLALRGLAEVNRGSGRGVPFTHLAALGDHLGSRAYKQYRFRDRDMAAIMTEWRYEVWRELHERGRVETFLFLDTGAVDRRLTDISSSELRWSYGFGFRTVWGGQVRWLTFLGFGDDGTRFDFDFSWVY
jgi:hypothetical protein